MPRAAAETYPDIKALMNRVHRRLDEDPIQVIVKNGGHNVFMLSPQITSVIQDFMRNEVLDTTEIEFQLPDFVPSKL